MLRIPRLPKPVSTKAQALGALNARFKARLAALTETALDPDSATRHLLARLRRDKPETCPVSPVMAKDLKGMRTPTYRDTFTDLWKHTATLWPQLPTRPETDQIADPTTGKPTPLRALVLRET